MRCTLGISTCPNDTFAFHAILEGLIDTRGLSFDVRLLDVQQLNELVVKRELDLSKVSYYAALQNASEYAMLTSGSALGYGVGPLLLRRPGAPPLSESARVLCPGELTTAHLLVRSFYPVVRNVTHAIFSEIMPALEREDADYGVVIHEGRFTYQSHGLELVADLGTSWEKRYSLPLPLGGIAGLLDLGDEVLRLADAVIRDSVRYAFSHREETFPTMAKYARELSPDVIWSHVDLYVNQWTDTLGSTGERAVRAFGEIARESGLLSGEEPSLVIVGDRQGGCLE